ncbi:diacylglycerol kinase (plasmid) [Ruegeria sp. AD91A]|uniref:c-type cytochrome n=1 Tax=Ruegeria sp. AD91A TaxID=2293862 RepID=UPI000E4D7A07|nr:cytochrome c [Ruegeria sp. AD91A]AXT28951.1 diacylglycerol kinase [Ruegeria sp. AD91A]
MRRLFIFAAVIAVLVGLVGLVLIRPKRVDQTLLDGVTPDHERGEVVFYAAGCASCHSAPSAAGEELLELAGGRRFETEFGTFIAPNISSDPVAGIGSWSALDLANALFHGTGPEGQHYFPAFPYTSYSNMTAEDVASLHAFLATLPAVATESFPHEVGFPFNIRRGLGGWKLLYLEPGWVVEGDLTDQQIQGRYLVEALGHCAECHTPRNGLGGLKRDLWLAGAPNPGGKGRIPGLTADQLDWSEADIAEYLKSGFTPDYDSAGGEMVEVIENTSRLSDNERFAIAAYLKAVPVPPIEPSSE